MKNDLRGYEWWQEKICCYEKYCDVYFASWEPNHFSKVQWFDRYEISEASLGKSEYNCFELFEIWFLFIYLFIYWRGNDKEYL